MERQKPIEEVKEDLQNVIFKVEKLHLCIEDLRNDFKDLNKKLENHFKECNKIDKELKDKLMVNGKSSYFPFW